MIDELVSSIIMIYLSRYLKVVFFIFSSTFDNQLPAQK